jgi:hypothetical protein
MPRDRGEIVKDLDTLLKGRLSQGRSIADLLSELSHIDGEGSLASGLVKGLRRVCEANTAPPLAKRAKLSESELHHLHLIFAARYVDSKKGIDRNLVEVHRFALSDGVPKHSIRYLRDKWTDWAYTGDPEEFISRNRADIDLVSARLNKAD